MQNLNLVVISDKHKIISSQSNSSSSGSDPSPSKHVTLWHSFQICETYEVDFGHLMKFLSGFSSWVEQVALLQYEYTKQWFLVSKPPQPQMPILQNIANTLICFQVVRGQNLFEVTNQHNAGQDRAPLRELFGSACQVFDHLAPEGSDLETICSLMPPIHFSYLSLSGVSPTTVEEKYDDCLREGSS